MIEIKGDLWDFHAKGNWVVITTNGSVRKDGYAVMGRGVAREASLKFPLLQKDLGTSIVYAGNHVWAFPLYKVVTFPVKHRWMEQANIDLIERSALELNDRVYRSSNYFDCSDPGVLYMVRPGCGNGGLLWKDVKPMISNILDNKFVIVERG